MEETLNQIANLGFPIVLSIYLLVRLEGKMEKLSESISRLSTSVDAITNQNSIGIELCINKDGCLCKTLDHAAILIKNLAKKHKIPKENILRHYDASRKICPRSLSSDNWQKWTEFKNKI